MSIKIILDTDIGSDLDDAIALTYLLAKPECELLGITTVGGEPEKRAMVASSLCRLAGRTVPIYPGAAKPLVIEQQQKFAGHANSLSAWPHDTEFPKGEAVEFLRRTIRQHPGEITLLTIGPLTNIAQLFITDPEIPSLLKALVMMCGYFQHKVEGWNKLEWNVKGDYHAADIVYRANVPVHRSIGIDVTTQVVLSTEDFKHKFSADIFRPLHDFGSPRHHNSNRVIFHDPLAATVIFNENICSFATGDVSIATENKETAGLTKFNLSNFGKHEIAVTVYKEKFFEEYFSAFRDRGV